MRFATVFLAVSLLLPGSIEAQPKRYTAKILIQVDEVVGPEVWQLLTPADRAQLQQLGIEVVDTEKVLRSPVVPFSGYWVQIGTRRYPIDRNGVLLVEQAIGTLHNVNVYAQVIDTRAFVIVPSLQFVPEGQNPEPALLKIKQRLHPKMNNETSVSPGSCFRKPCAATGSPAANASGCCLDYDGPEGDRKPYNRDGGPACFAKGNINFIRSTCFFWALPDVLRRHRKLACANESALIWNLVLNPRAPVCYANHKYRNCQSLNEDDFSVNPGSATVSFGKSVILKLRNNTPDNSTCLRITGSPGSPKLSLASSSGRVVASAYCGGYRADHWSDKSRKHLEDLSVRFSPGPAPKNKCDVTYHVLGAAADQTADTTIAVHNDKCGSVWAGAVRYIYKEEGSGGPLVSDNYTEEQTWTLIGPTSANPQIYDATWKVTANGSGQFLTDCRARTIKKSADGSLKVQMDLDQNSVSPYFQLSTQGESLREPDAPPLPRPVIPGHIVNVTHTSNCGTLQENDTEDIWQWLFMIRVDTPPGNDIAGSRDITASELTGQTPLWAYTHFVPIAKKSGKLTWSLHRVQ